MKDYKGIIFDLDGTLLNTIEDLTDSVNEVMKRYGFPIHETKDCKKMVGNGFRSLLRRALPIEKQQEESLIDEALNQFSKAYQERYLHKTSPYQGIPELVDELAKRGIALAVNSNKREDYTSALIQKFFARISFAAVYGEREKDGIPKKPDPTAALKITELMGFQPNEILYIGDSKTDMETGRNAGMDTVGVTWGFRDREELEKNDASYIADHPEDIISLI